MEKCISIVWPDQFSSNRIRWFSDIAETSLPSMVTVTLEAQEGMVKVMGNLRLRLLSTTIDAVSEMDTGR